MRPIKRAIILCWIMLVACFAIKLFGGNWFEVVCTNEHFSNLCDYVNRTPILYEGIAVITYLFSAYFIILSASRKSKISIFEFFLTIICFSLCWALKFISHNLKSIFELLLIWVFPIILNKSNFGGFFKSFKKTWHYGIIGNFLVLSFQVISLITRNISLSFITGNFMLSMILLVDYYIMIFLYFLYVKQKEVNKNG